MPRLAKVFPSLNASLITYSSSLVSVNIVYELLLADPRYSPQDEQHPSVTLNESAQRHSSWYQLNALLSLGRYEEAVTLLGTHFVTRPLSHSYIMYVYLHTGTMDSNIVSIDTFRRICVTLALNDRLDFAESIYQDAMRLHASNQVPTYSSTRLHSSLIHPLQVDSTLDNMELVGKIDREISNLYSSRAVWLANAEKYELLEDHLVGTSRKINSYSHYKVVNG